MIATDKDTAFYLAMNEVFSERTEHRDVKYKNTVLSLIIAVLNRDIAMKGLKDEFSALRILGAFEEERQLLNMKRISRSEKRNLIPSKIRQYNEMSSYAN